LQILLIAFRNCCFVKWNGHVILSQSSVVSLTVYVGLLIALK